VPARLTVPLHAAGDRVRTLQVGILGEGGVAFDRLRIARNGDVGAEARIVAPVGSVAILEERSCSSLHAERVELSTLADFPGFLVRLRCERTVRSLQFERTFTLPLHRELTFAARGEDGKGLREPFVLRAREPGVPDVVVAPLRLGRYEKLQFADGVLSMRSAPETGHESILGFVFCERDQSDRLRTRAAAMLAELAAPQAFSLGTAGEAMLASPVDVPFPRIVRISDGASTPLLVREGGWWTWRGTQPAPGGGRWLRIRHEGPEPVMVVGGAAVLARTRPGPGSLHVLALRDPAPLRVTARVVQRSVIVPPSVVMASDFDEVVVNGEPWAWFAGRKVFLPDEPGTYRIECRAHGGGPGPGVTATQAPLSRCEYDGARGVLTLVTSPERDRPIELPWTAVLRGPRPSRILNGELVDEGSLRHADAETARRAAAGGTVIRFRAGVTEVIYER
jgi:hypothetical protein